MPVTINHILTATTPDNTSYEIRPSHWNSVHTATLSVAGSEMIGGFSNANNVTFGTTPGGFITATASLAALTGVAFSAGTVLATSGTVNLSNANGVTWGMDTNNNVTATFVAVATAGIGAVSAGAGTITSGTVVFSNSNGVSFGVNGNTVTGSVSFGGVAIQAGTQAASSGSVVFSNSNGVTFGMSNSSVVTASVAPAIGIAAGTQTASSGTVVFSNSNNITFGMTNTSVVTASYSQSAGTLGLYQVINTTGQSSSSTVDPRSFTINGQGCVSVGMSASSLVISAPATTAWTPLSVGMSTAGATLGTTGFATQQLVLVGASNVTLSGSTNAGSMTISLSAGAGGQSNQTIGMYAVGNTTNNSSTTFDARTISLSINGAGTFGFSNGSVQLSLPATSSLSGTGAVSMSTNGSTVSIGVPTLATATRFIWPPDNMLTVGAFTNGSISLQYVPLYQTLTATRVDALAEWAAASTSSAVTMAIALSAYCAIYTRNASTLSSLSSGSTQTTYSYASNSAGQTQLISAAIRPISVPININASPGEYFVGFNISTNSSSIGAATTNLGQSVSMVAGSMPLTAFNYQEFTAQTATSVNLYSGMGLYSATSAGLPAAISLSGINGTGSALTLANLALVFRNA